MQINSPTPFIIIREVWTEHDSEFYFRESEWLLASLAGRLRKISFQAIENEAMNQLLYLFKTDWFRGVKIGSAGTIILERRRGHIFFVIRRSDLRKIKEHGMHIHVRNRYVKQCQKAR